MSVGTDSETRQQTLNIPIQMAVEIKRVDLENKKEVKAFIRFNYELYKENPYSVPDLLEDMYETYDPKRNDAFTFCEADLFLALRDGKIVGREACIKNNKANRIWNNNNGRFGYIYLSTYFYRSSIDWYAFNIRRHQQLIQFIQ